MACGDHKHPLQRGGTSQAQRFALALEPDYVQIDEKSIPDRIVFATRFAEYLTYYDFDNQPDGVWTPFFANNVTAILASVAVQDVDAYRREIAAHFETIRSDDNAGESELLKRTLAALFSGILTFSTALDDLTGNLPDEPPFKISIRNLIEAKLAAALRRLLSYYKAGLDQDLLVEVDMLSWKILGAPVVKGSTSVAEGLSADWMSPAAADWATYYAGILSDATIYGNPAGTVFEKISHAANHNLFSTLFEQFLMAYARVVEDAGNNLEITLGEWRKHPAHYALFLAFLKLIEALRGQLNEFTQRRLDFYYREALRLKPRVPEPNFVHLIVELAKAVESHLLSAGAQFRAGKDARGKEVFYQLTKDVVFNKAHAARFLSVYRGSTRDDIGAVVNEGRLFASPVANSADGLGADIKTAAKEWHPFINRTYRGGDLVSLDAPRAAIGFALASTHLYLAEGQRSVTVSLACSNNAAIAAAPWEVRLTAEKGWHAVNGLVRSVGVLANSVTSCVNLSFTLDPLVPAITDYDAAAHGGSLNVALPVAKFVLSQPAEAPYAYDSLREVTVTHAEIHVDVGDATSTAHTPTGLRQLNVSSDFGPVDPAKPFHPWGPQPVAGASLVIGSAEIFRKPGARVRFHFEWGNLPSKADDIDYNTDPPIAPSVDIHYLSGGIWKTLATDILPFNGISSTVAFPSDLQTIPPDGALDDLEFFGPFTTASKAGFFRLRLKGSFGHKEYQEALTVYLIDQAKTATTGTKPTEPYSPLLQSVAISYHATTTTHLLSEDADAFEKRSVRMFHCYPFGEMELHRQIIGASSIPLLPQFVYTEMPSDAGAGSSDTGFTLHNAGEFYIGLESLRADQSVSLLFQVLEGSTDPLVLKPEPHLYYSYLAHNQWKPLRRTAVSDHTRGLTQSGLMEFSIPEDATTDNTILPVGYVWFRISVESAVDTVCKLVGVHAQAAFATFAATPLNEPDFPGRPLPAGTISKLKTPDAAVKKIAQPYASAGGRGTESARSFYARASERLRHKARAIAIWDYERLVLEAFPQIYKVKCLSHTKLIPDPDDTSAMLYSELAPGHVTVVTLPNLAGRSDANPLRPYTRADLLLEIEEYLRARTSCQVNIIAANPLFEEVRLECTVSLLKGFNDLAFYKTQLENELTQHLAPWAFSGSAELEFGGKIYKSALINFIEERAYVDFVTDVHLYHKPGDTAPESGDLEEVTATTARSILVPAAATAHQFVIQLYQDPSAILEVCETDE